MKQIALGIAAFALSAVSAGAAVFDNPYDPGYGNEATRWVQSSEFSLDSDTVLTGGSVYIGGLGDISAWDGTFNYWIFNDDGGAPGSIETSGSDSTVSTTDTGDAWLGGGNVFELQFDLTNSFSATGGDSYWLGVQLSSDFARDDIYWVISSNSGASAQSENGSFDNWFTYTPARAFSLEGTTRDVFGATPAPVPLPASGILLVVGLGVLAGKRRRAA
ncbi:MAG: VPLPA-CTERM sorting domain-containing protein [Paracoccaceae bacterium]